MMLTQQETEAESSVVFNLRQLMQLERDRLHSEANAVRERIAAAERARAERAAEERAQQAERARQAERAELERAQQAERSELERQAALLRVRLEAEAAERSSREHRDREHALALQTHKRTRAAILAAGLCVALIGAAIAGRALQTPAGQPAADSGMSALLATQARELEQLREYVSSLRARPEPTPAVLQTPSVTPASKPPARRKLVLHVVPKLSGTELDGIDKAGDDPIGDLDAH